MERASEAIASLSKAHGVGVVAIGDGTGTRQAELAAEKAKVPFAIVSESGASVYSVSPAAERDLPGMDPLLRGAVSIARRLQDPLAEICKCPPQSVGAGMYQHDLSESELKTAGKRVVETAINDVGVDVYSASVYLLTHISGLSETLAKRYMGFCGNLRS
jgi:uncharacterized protein